MKKLIIVLLLMVFALTVFAQERRVEGVVWLKFKRGEKCFVVIQEPHGRRHEHNVSRESYEFIQIGESLIIKLPDEKAK